MTDEELDVLIVGGGPTGVFTACTIIQASKNTARIRLIEKTTERVPWSKVRRMTLLDHVAIAMFGDCGSTIGTRSLALII